MLTGQAKSASMISRLLILVTLVSICGCGPAGVTNRKTIPIKGMITFNGEPIEDGTILLEPKDGKGASASAKINDGRYETRIEPGIKTVRINYPKVMGQQIVYPGSPDSPVIDKIVEQIPDKYNSRTRLEKDLTEVTGDVDFKLDSK